MDLLNELRDQQLFNGSREHICLVRFVFLDGLQRHLDECKDIWNPHTMRPVMQFQCPSGKPDVMYTLPHRFVYITPIQLCHLRPNTALIYFCPWQLIEQLLLVMINQSNNYIIFHIFANFMPRFNGRDCARPVSQEDLEQFVVQPTRSPCGDEQLETHFEELQRQGGLTQCLTWECAVENYITLKNMAGI